MKLRRWAWTEFSPKTTDMIPLTTWKLGCRYPRFPCKYQKKDWSMIAKASFTFSHARRFWDSRIIWGCGQSFVVKPDLAIENFYVVTLLWHSSYGNVYNSLLYPLAWSCSTRSFCYEMGRAFTSGPRKSATLTNSRMSDMVSLSYA